MAKKVAYPYHTSKRAAAGQLKKDRKEESAYAKSLKPQEKAHRGYKTRIWLEEMDKAGLNTTSQYKKATKRLTRIAKRNL